MLLRKTLEAGCLPLQRLLIHRSISVKMQVKTVILFISSPPTVPYNAPEKVCSGHLRVTRKNPKTLYKAWFDCRCGTRLRLHPITTVREPCWECRPLLGTKTGKPVLVVLVLCVLGALRVLSAGIVVVWRTIICCQSNRGTLAGTQLIMKR